MSLNFAGSVTGGPSSLGVPNLKFFDARYINTGEPIEKVENLGRAFERLVSRVKKLEEDYEKESPKLTRLINTVRDVEKSMRDADTLIRAMGTTIRENAETNTTELNMISRNIRTLGTNINSAVTRLTSVEKSMKKVSDKLARLERIHKIVDEPVVPEESGASLFR